MSNRMKAEVQSRPQFHKKAITVIPSGIDLEHFVPIDQKDARCSLGEPNDSSPWVLFSTLTRNNPTKRFLLAQQAVSLAQREIPELKLKIMNGIDHSKVPSYVNASNVILLTSTHEGWPNIIKEGLACNIPFVSTDVSDLASIANQEKTCCVCRPSADELAKGLVRAVQERRPENMRRHVLTMDASLIAQQLVELYDKVLYSGARV
jgi:glycosyltransferase involved in cell wall biosynthesis